MIIIHVFQMDINCLLMKYVNVLIIIHVFQMDIICVLIKYYFHVYFHNSWHFMDIICILMKYYLMFMIVIHVFQKQKDIIASKDINCI